jgi:hypothetical protein
METASAPANVHRSGSQRQRQRRCSLSPCLSTLIPTTTQRPIFVPSAYLCWLSSLNVSAPIPRLSVSSSPRAIMSSALSLSLSLSLPIQPATHVFQRVYPIQISDRDVPIQFSLLILLALFICAEPKSYGRALHSERSQRGLRSLPLMPLGCSLPSIGIVCRACLSLAGTGGCRCKTCVAALLMCRVVHFSSPDPWCVNPKRMWKFESNPTHLPNPTPPFQAD